MSEISEALRTCGLGDAAILDRYIRKLEANQRDLADIVRVFTPVVDEYNDNVDDVDSLEYHRYCDLVRKANALLARIEGDS